MKSIFRKVWAFIVGIFAWLWDQVTDEKGQGDERRVLGIACFAAGIYLALSIPALVLVTKDLASAGALAAVIAILFSYGSILLNIARKADGAILNANPPLDVIGLVQAAAQSIKGELAAKPEPDAKVPAPQ